MWDRFSSSPDEQRWYYEELGKTFASGPLAGTPLERRYRGALSQLAKAAGSTPPGFD